jgi:hypothetical protein
MSTPKLQPGFAPMASAGVEPAIPEAANDQNNVKNLSWCIYRRSERPGTQKKAEVEPPFTNRLRCDHRCLPSSPSRRTGPSQSQRNGWITSLVSAPASSPFLSGPHPTLLNPVHGKKNYRLFSAYGSGIPRFWIITGADRSVTTVLMPEDFNHPTPHAVTVPAGARPGRHAFSGFLS